MRHISLLAVAAALLVPAALPAQKQDDSIKRAATQPLRDARIEKDKIPEILQLAASAPYSTTAIKNCAAIGAEVRQLDAALGLDVDQPAKTKGEAAAIAAAAARGAVSAFIPGLGVVRVLTGADKAQRRVEAAVFAGAVRRGYLKGLGLQRGCRPPAAPSPEAVNDTPALPPPDDKEK